MTHREREKLAYQYHAALERGDFETIAAILQIAEDDVVLWEMIDGINQELLKEICRNFRKGDRHATL